MWPLLQTDLPPSNLPYLVSAFVVTGVAFLGYIYFIFKRRQETRNEIGRLLTSLDKEEPNDRATP